MKFQRVISNVALAVALGAAASCGTAFRQGPDGIHRIELAFLAPDSDYLVCPVPLQPQAMSGDSPAASAAYLAEEQRFIQDQQRYHACIQKVSSLDPGFSIAVVVDAPKAMDKQAEFLAKREDKSQLEKYNADLNATNQSILDTLKAASAADVKPEVTINPVITINPETTVTPGTTVTPIVSGESPAPQALYQPGVPGAVRAAAGAWVTSEYQQHSLSMDQQRAICNNDQVQGYAVEGLGAVRFAECGFDVPSDNGLVARLSGMALHGDLANKTILLCGNADQYSAARCPSQTNTNLSGHRAVNVLNALAITAGDKALEKTHADVCPNGDALDERSVQAYIVMPQQPSS
ncbi:hypothetical protein HYU19_02745 [Candidatus Woesearchaeota archaeon]|nr:hypothetical protein [Candidatus Woesearchaeota archaeon]